jgi:hypothetical protein
LRRRNRTDETSGEGEIPECGGRQQYGGRPQIARVSGQTERLARLQLAKYGQYGVEIHSLEALQLAYHGVLANPPQPLSIDGFNYGAETHEPPYFFALFHL